MAVSAVLEIAVECFQTCQCIKYLNSVVEYVWLAHLSNCNFLQLLNLETLCSKHLFSLILIHEAKPCEKMKNCPRMTVFILYPQQIF